MNVFFPYRICRILWFYYILIWINLLNGKPLHKNRNVSDCEPEFETNVQHCLHGHEWKTNVQKFQISNTVFKEILKRFFCRQYISSLQCLHEILDDCKTDKTTGIIQNYLSQPWAHRYNTFCDINQQNSSFTSKNMLPKPRQSLSSDSRLNLTVIQNTEDSTIKEMKIPISEINKSLVVKKETHKSEISNNELGNLDLGGQQTIPTANTRKKFSKSTLFYSKNAKTENDLHGNQTETINHHLVFQKLVSKKPTMSIQSTVVDNQSYQPSGSKFEISFEIQ